MEINREILRRMFDGLGSSGGGTTVVGGGGDATMATVEAGYVSKPFFSQGFVIEGTKTTTVGSAAPTVEAYQFAPNEQPGTITTTEGGVTTTVVTAITRVRVVPGVIRIGDGVLKWSSQNNAFYVEKQDGTAANFYATGGVSALGYGSGGGGGTVLMEPLASINTSGLAAPTAAQNGMTIVYNNSTGKWEYGTAGGSTTLAALTDTAISNPTNGQVLMYNATSGKWYNGTVQGGSSEWTDITGKPTTISGYGITDAKIDNGVITLGSNSITPLTASAISDMATKTWVGQQGYLTSSAIRDMATKTWVGQQGFLTSSAISDMATKTWVGQQGFLTSSAISDMATKTWVGQQGFLTSSAISDMATKTWVGQHYLGINATAAKAAMLTVNGPFTAWGQTYWEDGVPVGSFSGNITDVGNIVTAANGAYYIQGFASIELISAASANHGGFIDFHYNGSSSDYTSRIIEDASGRLFLNASNGIRIGDGLISWDSANNAFKVERISGSSVVAGNLYATGGLSALGAWAGANGSLSLTSLDVSGNATVGTLRLSDANTYIQKSGNQVYFVTNASNGFLFNGGVQITADGTLSPTVLSIVSSGNIFEVDANAEAITIGSEDVTPVIYIYDDSRNKYQVSIDRLKSLNILTLVS